MFFSKSKKLTQGKVIYPAIIKLSLLRKLCNLSVDENVKELQQRINGTETVAKRAISWENFFMRMAKLSQNRPGDFSGKAVKYFCKFHTSFAYTQ